MNDADRDLVSAVADNPLIALLNLGHQARAAGSADELAFMFVNDSRVLWPYRQAALWFGEGGIRTLSGVVQPERNAPYAQWLERLCRALNQTSATTQCAADQTQLVHAQRVDRRSLPPDIREQWAEWLPQEAVWLPIAASSEHAGSTAGGLLLAGDTQCPDAALALLSEWLHTWRHAWLARHRAPFWSRILLKQKPGCIQPGPSRAPWRRRSAHIAILALCATFIPIRLTVLAPGELIPANPALIRAPLDGVIGQFHVRPNETVKAGQLLFTFDQAPIASRFQVARQALATAETEYRQFAQLALNDDKSKLQLATLIGKISEKRAEAEFLQNQFERSRVVAPRDGIALFDDPSEWVGRPVQTGERVMRLATPNETQIEAWLAIGDAIPIEEQAPVKLYLAATPLDSVSGRVRYIGHDAMPRPDGSYAYRIRAQLDENTPQRIGQKGTVKLYGDWVPLGYWILRRPLATVRQYLAF